VLRLLERLSSRPRTTCAVAVAYLLAVTVSHDWMQQPAYWAQGELSHERWNNLVTAVAAPMLIAFCVWLVIKLRSHARPFLAIGYLVLTVALAVVSFRTLLVMNIEVVHFPQYAVLGGLAFAATGRYGSSMLWCTPGAMVDEGYQYFYLYAGRGIHYDFNDVVLDSIGAGFGLVLVFICATPASRLNAGMPCRPMSILKCQSLWTSGALAAFSLSLYLTGFLRLLPDPQHRPLAIVLRRGGPSTMFWTPTTWGKTYHELQPLEWLFITVVLVVVYSMMDFIRPGQGARGHGPLDE